jgi:hypothetical protein
LNHKENKQLSLAGISHSSTDKRFSWSIYQFLIHAAAKKYRVSYRHIKSRRMRWAGHEAHIREKRKMYKVLVEKPKERRPLGRPRERCEDGIRMDLREIGWCREGGVDSTGLE